MRYETERRLLQAAVLLAGTVPVSAGAAGVFFGAALFTSVGAGADLDSHVRYLSGLLLAIGLIFWSRIPGIERRPRLFRLLAGIVVVGGLGRLVGVVIALPPSLSMLAALAMELVVTPLLSVWQARIAALAASRETERN